MFSPQMVREWEQTRVNEAKQRLANEGIVFHSAELAYQWSIQRDELRAWEALGAVDMVTETKLILDDISARDDAERAAWLADQDDQADALYEAMIDAQADSYWDALDADSYNTPQEAA